MTTPREPLGIIRVEALHYYVHDLDRSRRFYLDRMDFAELAASSPELERDGRQRSAVFQAADVRVLCSQPVGEGGRAWRYLRKHPDGIGAVVFEVEDAGPGFPAADEPRPQKDRPEGSLGLGLVLVRRIADAHHGRVVIGNRPGGQGARVSLELQSAAPTDA